MSHNSQDPWKAILVRSMERPQHVEDLKPRLKASQLSMTEVSDGSDASIWVVGRHMNVK